jgi:hypothetical protein
MRGRQSQSSTPRPARLRRADGVGWRHSRHAPVPRGDFWPVFAVVLFDDEDEVVALANDTEYGLAAAIWTRDVSRAVSVL